MSPHQITAPAGRIFSWHNYDVPEHSRFDFSVIDRMVDSDGNVVGTGALDAPSSDRFRPVCTDKSEDHAAPGDPFDSLDGLLRARGAGSSPLRSHPSQDSIGSAPSLAGSETTVSEPDLDGEAGSPPQEYVLPSSLQSRSSMRAVRPSPASTSTASSSRSLSRNRSDASHEVADNLWLGHEIDLPGATDPLASMGAHHNRMVVGPEGNLPDAKANLLAGVGAQFA